MKKNLFLIIEGKVFKVNYVRTSKVLDSPTAGLIDYMKGVICISTDRPRDAQDETLLHEIIHGILPPSTRDEEKFVEVFAPRLFGVLKTNGLWRSPLESKEGNTVG